MPAALDRVVAFLRAQIGSLPTAIGHRVVHGGPTTASRSLIDDAVLDRLASLFSTGPTPSAEQSRPHPRCPAATAAAAAGRLLRHGVSSRPSGGRRPLCPPRAASITEGVRRYGFHGLSYEYIASRLPEIAPDIAQGRVVVAHLGSGASMCAISAGKSVESTMGFTALDGLPMGTRPGQLDPGIVLYLMTRRA